jgi:homoisocitrate dehydrogenase
MRRLCVIEGDGIGQEVIPAAVRVLQAALTGLELVSAPAGWQVFQRCGLSVPPETLAAVRACGAALFGAVSSPAEKVPGYRSAALVLRQELDLFANLRPVRSWPGVSPRAGVDLLIVRENTEGLYAGRERLEGQTAIAERVITRQASERIGRKALELARQAGRRLTIVHKANILQLTDGLFRAGVRAAAQQMAQDGGAEVVIDELLVDTAAHLLASQPEGFEVLVTTNLFGDILSDVAAVWCGGLGMAPSLNWGEQVAIAEPVHGSAPDIAGQGLANPLAAILSAALLCRHCWQEAACAGRIEAAVQAALVQEIPLQGGRVAPGVPTAAITQAVLRHL